MAVCRGKVSEGYNFKDNLARAVFIVGYPLMSFDCIPYKIKEYTYKNAAKLSKWYYDDAMNAIKQAMGRGIRHPKDFACIYLIGQKMFEKRRSLPNWVSEDQVFEGCSLSEALKETRKFMV
jgi:Rad3-related DNA helicase